MPKPRSRVELETMNGSICGLSWIFYTYYVLLNTYKYNGGIYRKYLHW